MKQGAFMTLTWRIYPEAGGFVGWGASDIDPAGKAVVTGAYARL